jgi:hypothetical protein
VKIPDVIVRDHVLPSDGIVPGIECDGERVVDASKPHLQTLSVQPLGMI